MKAKIFIACCLCGLFTGTGEATLREVPAVGLLSMSQNGGKKQRFPQPGIYVTGGDNLSLTVASSGFPFGSEIELIQTAGGMAVKLKIDITVGKPDASVLSGIYTVDFVVPQVKKRTTCVLRLHQNTFTDIPLIIFPPEDKVATGRTINQKMRENNMAHIAVFHPGEYIAADFLVSRGVKTNWTESLSGALCLVEVFAKDLNNLPPVADDRSRVIIFIRDAADLPGIYTTVTAAGGAVTKVTLPILNDLDTNPRSREIFLNLINRHLSRELTPEN